MNYKLFLKFLINIGDLTLPGKKAHNKMSPPERDINIQFQPNNTNFKEAAVLILVYPSFNGNPCIALIERSDYVGVHSSQISFPGGRFEFSDNSFWDTAIRETAEEIGIDNSVIKFLKEMSMVYIPPSNFKVFPFIGYVDKKPLFKLDKNEVKSIIELPISDLLRENNKAKKSIITSYMRKVTVPMYIFEDNYVWGATAMILSEFELLILDVLNKKNI